MPFGMSNGTIEVGLTGATTTAVGAVFEVDLENPLEQSGPV